MRIDVAQARSALQGAARRTSDLLGSLDDGDLPVKGLTWTVGEVGAHLVVALQAFTEAVTGSFDAVSPHISDTVAFPDRLSRVTAGTLALVPERHTGTLAGLVRQAGTRPSWRRPRGSRPTNLSLLPGTRPTRFTPWYAPQASLSLATATCLLVGEQVVHGYDIGRTARARRRSTGVASSAADHHGAQRRGGRRRGDQRRGRRRDGQQRDRGREPGNPRGPHPARGGPTACGKATMRVPTRSTRDEGGHVWPVAAAATRRTCW